MHICFCLHVIKRDLVCLCFLHTDCVCVTWHITSLSLRQKNYWSVAAHALLPGPPGEAARKHCLLEKKYCLNKQVRQCFSSGRCLGSEGMRETKGKRGSVGALKKVWKKNKRAIAQKPNMLFCCTICQGWHKMVSNLTVSSSKSGEQRGYYREKSEPGPGRHGSDTCEVPSSSASQTLAASVLFCGCPSQCHSVALGVCSIESMALTLKPPLSAPLL